MPFESFDNRIKDAAEKHEPPFEDRSWNKMQTLLDAELPHEKKDRRRFLLLLLMLLLLGGGTLYITNRNKTDKTVAGNTPASTILPVENTRIQPQANPVHIESQQHIPDIKQLPNVSGSVNDNKIISSTTPLVQGKTSSFNKKGSASFNTRNGRLSQTNNSSVTGVNNDNPVNNEQKQITTINTNTVSAEPITSKKDENKVAETTDPSKPITQSTEIIQEESKVATPVITNESKKKKTKGVSDIAFSVSAGPDVSMVSLDNTGRTLLAYGVGLSYPITKKLSLRTGFYAARKIYSAKPEDYDPPKEFWNWYPNLKSIDANCMVYEIPLIVDYQFGKQKQWFVSTGLSSIIMKQEDYDYTYRPPYSQNDVTYRRTHKNENDHLFSMLHLSGGYTYKLTDRISMRAEPYVKVPLNGIGYGKIKLNSGGALMSVIVKPFNKR